MLRVLGVSILVVDDEDDTRDLLRAVLTAYARPEDRTRALTSGFDHHIAKPVQRVELLAVIANLTRRLSRP